MSSDDKAQPPKVRVFSVPSALIASGAIRKLTGADLHVYIYLRYRRNRTEGMAWPGVRTIAEDLDIDKGTVSRSLQKLQKLKLIHIHEHAKRGEHGTKFRFDESCARATLKVAQAQRDGCAGASPRLRRRVHNSIEEQHSLNNNNIVVGVARAFLVELGEDETAAEATARRVTKDRTPEYIGKLVEHIRRKLADGSVKTNAVGLFVTMATKGHSVPRQQAPRAETLTCAKVNTI